MFHESRVDLSRHPIDDFESKDTLKMRRALEKEIIEGATHQSDFPPSASAFAGVDISYRGDVGFAPMSKSIRIRDWWGGLGRFPSKYGFLI